VVFIVESICRPVIAQTPFPENDWDDYSTIYVLCQEGNRIFFCVIAKPIDTARPLWYNFQKGQIARV